MFGLIDGLLTTGFPFLVFLHPWKEPFDYQQVPVPSRQVKFHTLNDAKWCHVILLVIGILGRGWNTSFFCFLPFPHRKKTPGPSKKQGRSFGELEKLQLHQKAPSLEWRLNKCPTKAVLHLLIGGIHMEYTEYAPWRITVLCLKKVAGRLFAFLGTEAFQVLCSVKLQGCILF